MFKLILIASSLAVILAVQNFNTPTKSDTKIERVKETIPVNPWGKPIALVKYHDMIYHCQGVVKTNCGHSLHCGNMSVHCVTDFEIEYLN